MPPAAEILVFLPDLDGGGAQRSFVNLANVLVQKGQRLVLVAGRGDGPARAWLSSAVSLIDFRAASIRSSILPLRRLIAERRPRVVLSTMADANAAAAMALFACSWQPKLVLRETNSHRARDDMGVIRRALIRVAYRRADAVVALSEGVRRELITSCRLPAAGVRTIHNPVDVNGLAGRADQLRAQASPPLDGAPYVIAIGRLTRQKGFDVLIRAFARPTMSSLRLVILGDGPDMNVLRSLAEQQGVGSRVLLPGFVADPLPWLVHAKAFVLSSRWEGFGHVIVEAMACRTPVIATNCPYGPADIVQDNVSGLLVPVEDHTALSHALQRVLADRALGARISAAAFASASRFDLPVIAEKYLGLLAECGVSRKSS